MNRDSASQKYLLCRPEGGLNDILCQVHKCYSYAKRWNRALIIDTNYPGSVSFKEKFSTYFNTKETDIFLDTAGLDLLESMSVHPSFLKGRINTYKIEWNNIINNFVDYKTQQPLNLKFDKDYTEQLIVHHGAGGGEKSVKVFDWLKLNQVILEELTFRIDKIGNKYTAIHIRHTDYQTDYKIRIQTLAKKIIGPVFIASDNIEVIGYCIQAFGNARTYTFSRLPDQAGKRIHIDHIDHGLLPFEANKDAIADLFTHVLSDRLYFFNIKSEGKRVRYSGFSRLAKNLRFFGRYLLSIENITDPVHSPSVKLSGRGINPIALNFWKIMRKVTIYADSFPNLARARFTARVFQRIAYSIIRREKNV